MRTFRHLSDTFCMFCPLIIYFDISIKPPFKINGLFRLSLDSSIKKNTLTHTYIHINLNCNIYFKHNK